MSGSSALVCSLLQLTIARQAYLSLSSYSSQAQAQAQAPAASACGASVQVLEVFDKMSAELELSYDTPQPHAVQIFSAAPKNAPLHVRLRVVSPSATSLFH